MNNKLEVGFVQGQSDNLPIVDVFMVSDYLCNHLKYTSAEIRGWKLQKNMELPNGILEKLKEYGVGRRKLDDKLFENDKTPPRLGVYDVDEENLCHELIETTCNVPGCKFTAESLLEFENHYNASHRYTCSQCKKVVPSPHLLDLHIQETHDSFFAVMSAKKPSYCCYIEECKEKFMDANERLNHCVKVHKLPKDFRFEQKPKNNKKKKKHNSKKQPKETSSMDIDRENIQKQFSFTNSRQKVFSGYSGKLFTQDKAGKPAHDVNMDEIMEELKTNLPE